MSSCWNGMNMPIPMAGIDPPQCSHFRLIISSWRVERCYLFQGIQNVKNMSLEP